MAFFTFRSGGSSQAELNSSAETVEAMRRRARHRLIGATVLVALGVIGFPLLFDTQPRPVAVDIPIEIPDKNKSAAPAAAPTPESDRVANAGSAAGAQGAAESTAVPAQSSLAVREQLVGPNVAAAPKPAAPAAAPEKSTAEKAADGRKPESKADSAARPESDSRSAETQKKTAVAKSDRAAEKPRDSSKTADKAASTASSNKSDLPPASRDDLRAARAEEAARARALLQGKPEKDAASASKSDQLPASRDDLRVARAEEAARARALLQGKSEKEAAAIAEGRFIVQVGAYSEAGLAQAARAKVERAGLRTYTQEAKTANGTWFRVRVGPFATRAEANAAASKIKGLSLPASILTL